MAEHPTHSRASKAAPPQAEADAAPKQTEEAAGPGEISLPVGQLASQSGALLGCPPFVAAGAFAYTDHGPDDTMTIAEAQGLVSAWLGQPDQTAAEEEE